MLASSVGQALTKHMHELLDLMVAYGLSEPLHKALNDLGRHIPQLLPTIQGQLLILHDLERDRLTLFNRATTQFTFDALEWRTVQDAWSTWVGEGDYVEPFGGEGYAYAQPRGRSCNR